MLAAPVPVGEAVRIAAVRSLAVLDTLPEERFDRITRLACRIFEAPMAMISVVDAQRSWSKSQQGLKQGETPRNESFCAHVVLADGPLVVSDCQADPRFRDNPWVTGAARVRFYAGQPIHSVDGARVGTLSIFDTKPRELDAGQLESLADLAALVDGELRAQDCSAVDGLTGLANRRGFLAVAEHLLATCRRSGRSATLIAVDLDGHDGGDENLRDFAQLLYQHFRASDVVARMGNDEFAVLCSGAATSQITHSLKRLREEFVRSSLAQRLPELGWNAGTAEYHPALDADIHALLRVAGARKHSARQQAQFARDLADL